MLLGRVWPQSQASVPNKAKDASAMAKATHLFSGCDVLACVHRISKARSSIADTARSLTMDCKGAVSRKFARCRKRLSGGIRLGQQCVMDAAMFLRSKRHVLNAPVQDLIDRQSGFAVGDLLCGFFFRRPKPRQFRRFYRSSRFARHKITVTVHRSLAKAKGTMVVNPLSLDRILTSVVTIRLDIWFYGKIPHAVHSSNPAC